MKSVNLYFLTRTHEQAGVSGLLNLFSDRKNRKEVSPHEAATLCCLVDGLSGCLRKEKEWIPFLDGFYFSFVIEHIGKEFDLLKLSSDSRTVLNIELKSEKVDEEKIRKQLEQNRYYLSHIANTIYSFTYVMETNEVYTVDSEGMLRLSGMQTLADALRKDGLQDYLSDGIERCFRAAEYLISPISAPEKFLQGKYFLTNQQADFRSRILEYLSGEASAAAASPVISISGIAGTGKTLLLLDLAMELSKEDRVLFIHSGPLRKGHVVLNEKLEGIDIISAETALTDHSLAGYGFVMIDEADHLKEETLDGMFAAAGSGRIPVILTYDPHRLLVDTEEGIAPKEVRSEAADRIGKKSTLSMAFTGYIRINRPVYSFLRALLYPKEHNSNRGYDCIDVLYANDRKEQEMIAGYYKKQGYVHVGMTGRAEKEDDILAVEYDKVIMILDSAYYYDKAKHLRVREREDEALRLLYEGLSRTKENLCLLITGNPELFLQILSLRNGKGTGSR